MKVIQLLKDRDLRGLMKLAAKGTSLPSTLVACLSELDDVVRWRAIEALGWVAADMAQQDLEAVRDLVRRLFWSMTEECGGTAWHAPEAIGEILARVPELAPDFASVLASHADIDPFQSGVLWSLRRLTPIRPDLVREEAEVLYRAAESPLPDKRGHAAVALGLLESAEARDALQRLSRDPVEVLQYDRQIGAMRKTTVRRLARTAPEALLSKPAAELADRQRESA